MTIFYTAHDAAGGGDGSLGDPWTLTEALTNATAVAGDTILVRATGTYAPAAEINPVGLLGVAGNTIRIAGANSDGTDDNTVAIISGSALGAGADIIQKDTNGTVKFTRWDNLRFTASPKNGWYAQTWDNPDGGLIFGNCRFDNCLQHGFENADGQAHPIFINCEADNNTSTGVQCTGNTTASAYGSVFHNNGVRGALSGRTEGGGTWIDCLFYRNTLDGLFYFIDGSAGASAGRMIIGCVFFANGEDGLEFVSGATSVSTVVTNCIFRSNGAFGINFNAGVNGGIDSLAALLNCCFSNNTSGDATFTLPTDKGHVFADPLFTSEVDGSENFTLKDGSPCLQAGFPASWPRGIS